MENNNKKSLEKIIRNYLETEYMVARASTDNKTTIDSFYQRLNDTGNIEKLIDDIKNNCADVEKSWFK